MAKMEEEKRAAEEERKRREEEEWRQAEEQRQAAIALAKYPKNTEKGEAEKIEVARMAEMERRTRRCEMWRWKRVGWTWQTTPWMRFFTRGVS